MAAAGRLPRRGRPTAPAAPAEQAPQPAVEQAGSARDVPLLEKAAGIIRAVCCNIEMTLGGCCNSLCTTRRWASTPHLHQRRPGIAQRAQRALRQQGTQLLPPQRPALHALVGYGRYSFAAQQRMPVFVITASRTPAPSCIHSASASHHPRPELAVRYELLGRLTTTNSDRSPPTPSPIAGAAPAVLPASATALCCLLPLGRRAAAGAVTSWGVAADSDTLRNTSSRVVSDRPYAPTPSCAPSCSSWRSSGGKADATSLGRR